MKLKKLFTILFTVLMSLSKSHAQTPYIGEIRMFAGNFAPRGWAFCDGSLLSIAQNDVLFAMIGTIYGGDGQNTFALPDFRGRAPIHQGNGYAIGQTGGAETVTLNINNLPAHTHLIRASTNLGTTNIPTNAVPANTSTLDKEYAATSNTTMAPTGNIGSAQPINIIKPYVGINYIISLEGVFPSPN